MLLLLCALFAVFAYSDVDLVVQDWFYDFAAGRWVVDGENSLGRLCFYQGPKVLIAAVGCGLLALAFGPSRWRRRLGWERSDLWIAILTMAVVPLLAGLGKRYSGMHCPAEISRYGGDATYEHLHLAIYTGSEPRGRCFPAAHASGGFALLGLAWLRRSARWRFSFVALGLTVGWWMGGYQMLRGAHFLSHTVVTMLLAWIVALTVRRLWRVVASSLRVRKIAPGMSGIYLDPA